METTVEAEISDLSIITSMTMMGGTAPSATGTRMPSFSFGVLFVLCNTYNICTRAVIIAVCAVVFVVFALAGGFVLWLLSRKRRTRGASKLTVSNNTASTAPPSSTSPPPTAATVAATSSQPPPASSVPHFDRKCQMTLLCVVTL